MDLNLTDFYTLSLCAAWNLSADIISTVEFDHTGDYLATGDKGGRVVLFERNQTVRSFNSTNDATAHDPFSYSITCPQIP